MASIFEALRSRVLTSGTIVTLLTDRIYYQKLPDNTLFPAISIEKVSSRRLQTLQGYSGLTDAFFSINIFSRSGGDSETIAKEVKTVLDGFRGTISGVDVQAVLSDNEINLWEQDTEVYHIVSDFRIFYVEE